MAASQKTRRDSGIWGVGSHSIKHPLVVSSKTLCHHQHPVTFAYEFLYSTHQDYAPIPDCTLHPAILVRLALNNLFGLFIGDKQQERQQTTLPYRDKSPSSLDRNSIPQRDRAGPERLVR
jgi:hypothetical protein